MIATIGVVTGLAAAAPAQAALVLLHYDVTVTQRCERSGANPLTCAPVDPAQSFLLTLAYDDAAPEVQLTPTASIVTVRNADFSGLPFTATLPPDPLDSSDTVEVSDVLSAGTVTRTVTAQQSDFTFLFDPASLHVRSASVTTRLVRGEPRPALVPLTSDDLRAALSIGVFTFSWESTFFEQFGEDEATERLLRYEGTAVPAPAPIPEPSSTLLAVAGSAWLSRRRRRARRRPR